MWVKLIIAENGYIMILMDKTIEVKTWIAQSAFDVKDRLLDIEDEINLGKSEIQDTQSE